MRYLLDTNVLSEAVKTNPDTAVMKQFEMHQHDMVTAAPVWHELQFGYHLLRISRKKEIIASFLDDIVRRTIPILPYDERAAEWHAKERARLSSKGVTCPFVDGQIAAVAKVNGLILVSRNIDDFKHFPEIKLENWHGI